MPEQEELVLRVSVDDQASAYMAGLKEQLAQLSSVAKEAGAALSGGAGGGGGQPAERQRRAHRESKEGVEQLTAGMRTMAQVAGVVGGVVGAVATKLTDLGTDFLHRITDLEGYARGVIKLQQESFKIGINPAQLEGATEAYRKQGYSAEEAVQQVQGLVKATNDLVYANSAVRRELMAGAQADPAAMQAHIAALQQAQSIEEKNNLVREKALKIHDDLIKAGRTELYAAEQMGNYLRTMGLRELPPELHVPTAAEIKLRQDREPEAKRFYALSQSIAISWEKTGQGFAAVALHVPYINNAMQTMADYGDRIVASLSDWEREFRKTDGSLNGLITATENWGKGLNNWVGKEILAITEGLKTTKQEFDAIYRFLQIIGAIEDEPPKPGSRAALRAEQLKEFQKREEEARRKQAEEDEELRLQQEREAAEHPPAPREGEPDAPPLGPRGYPLPPGAAPPPAATPPPVPRSPRTRDPNAVELPAGGYRDFDVEVKPLSEPRATAPAPTQRMIDKALLATPQPWYEAINPFSASSIARDEAQRRLDAGQNAPAAVEPRAAAPAAAAPQPLLSPQPQPAPQPQPLPEPIPPQPIPQPLPQPQPAPQPFFQPPQEQTTFRMPTGAGAPAAPDRSGLYLLPPRTGEGGAVDRLNPDYEEIGRRQIEDRRGEPPVEIEKGDGGGGLVVPPREKLSFAPEQPVPSAFAPGRPIDLAGTGSPWQAAAEKGQTPNWMDFASAGPAIDRAAQQEVAVNGTGKISVDFQNMPRGVTGKAEGDGLFRRTEITRQVQMEPAVAGPSLPMGA